MRNMLKLTEYSKVCICALRGYSGALMDQGARLLVIRVSGVAATRSSLCVVLTHWSVSVGTLLLSLALSRHFQELNRAGP